MKTLRNSLIALTGAAMITSTIASPAQAETEYDTHPIWQAIEGTSSVLPEPIREVVSMSIAVPVVGSVLSSVMYGPPLCTTGNTRGCED